MIEPRRGSVAVITGAASGIGRGIALAAGAQGMRLVLADIAEAPLRAFAEMLRADGIDVLPLVTDVTDPLAIEQLAAASHDHFGDVRLLFANAGIESLGFAWELTVEQWRRAIDINLLGMIHSARAFLPGMIESRQPAGIVFTGSIGSLGMTAASSPYIVSKHAILSFAECLAIECGLIAPHVAISIALPGPVASSIFTDADGAPGSDAVDRQRAIMSRVVGEGLSIEEAGRMILEQAIEGRFWIATHADMLDASLERRATYLQAKGRPAMPAAALDYLVER